MSSRHAAHRVQSSNTPSSVPSFREAEDLLANRAIEQWRKLHGKRILIGIAGSPLVPMCKRGSTRALASAGISPEQPGYWLPVLASCAPFSDGKEKAVLEAVLASLLPQRGGPLVATGPDQECSAIADLSAATSRCPWLR